MDAAKCDADQRQAEVRLALGEAQVRAFRHVGPGDLLAEGYRSSDRSIAAIGGATRKQAGLAHGRDHRRLYHRGRAGYSTNLANATPSRPQGGAMPPTRWRCCSKTPTRRAAALGRLYKSQSCDHGMNASTFLARIISADAGRPVLRGDGRLLRADGAAAYVTPEPVLEMLDAIGTREKIKPWIDGKLPRRTADGPRPSHLPRARSARRRTEDRAGKLASSSIDMPFAAEVEAYAREALLGKEPDHPLDTNMEFCRDLLDALQIPHRPSRRSSRQRAPPLDGACARAAAPPTCCRRARHISNIPA